MIPRGKSTLPEYMTQRIIADCALITTQDIGMVHRTFIKRL